MFILKLHVKGMLFISTYFDNIPFWFSWRVLLNVLLVLRLFMQWVWLASRKRLPFRTPAPPPFWALAYVPIVETSFTEFAVFRLFTLKHCKFIFIPMHDTIKITK